MAAVNVSSSRIRGSIFGMLAGDCLGSPNEFINTSIVSNKLTYVDRVCDFIVDFPESWLRNNTIPKVAYFSGFTNYLRPLMVYSGAFALTKNVMESLIEYRGYNAENMARKFTETYFTEGAVCDYLFSMTLSTVFEKMRRSNYQNIYAPAKELYAGNGSFGSFGAVRTSPVALFYANDLEISIEIAKQQCLLTHSHPNAIMAAVLQTAAVHLALNRNNSSDINEISFLKDLCAVMINQQPLIYKNGLINPFIAKMSSINELLNDDSSIEQVAKKLGNGTMATNSVPTAIFAFLKCLKPVDEIDLLNPVLRTIAYSVSLGGDTTTITCMAGAIAGAFYGDAYIPITWLRTFEGAPAFVYFAKELCRRLSINDWVEPNIYLE